jgi:hypothetical protein
MWGRMFILCYGTFCRGGCVLVPFCIGVFLSDKCPVNSPIPHLAWFLPSLSKGSVEETLPHVSGRVWSLIHLWCCPVHAVSYGPLGTCFWDVAWINQNATPQKNSNVNCCRGVGCSRRRTENSVSHNAPAIFHVLKNVILFIYFFAGEVTKHGDVKCIMNEGMPQYKNPFEKGRLIIQFLVNFPSSLPPELIPQLENCLPPR